MPAKTQPRTKATAIPEFLTDDEVHADEFILERITVWVERLTKLGVTPDKAADISSEFFFAAFQTSTDMMTEGLWADTCGEEDDE